MAEPTYDLFIIHADADRAWVDRYLRYEVGVEPDRLITRHEFELGRGRLIALTLHPCQPPPRLRFRVGRDCTDETQWGEQIKKLRDFLGCPEPPPEVIPCPYPGMAPFQPKEARFFFGRDAEIKNLLTKLRAHRFLMVIGSSGSGKSSLVLAGLLPRLADPNLFPPGTWKVITLRPGATPSTELVIELGGEPEPPDPVLTTLLVADPLPPARPIWQAEASGTASPLALASS